MAGVINRLHWWQTVRPNLPASAPPKAYVQTWLWILVARWDATISEMKKKQEAI